MKDIDIIKKIKKTDIISFDIFDTLIKRNCQKPTDIFEIVERKYNKNKNENNRLYNFKERRIKAEKKSRNNCINEETTLDMIYDYLEINENIKDNVKEIEKETEIEFCIPNMEMKKIYDYCVTANKKIIYTTDMYLPRDTILKILENSNYDITNKLYLSSEIGLTKYKGSLYQYIINDQKNKNILHIGDNKKADFVQPILNGIKSKKIAKNSKKTKIISEDYNNLEENIIFSIINNNTKNYKSYVEKLGYELIGPITLSFCIWINNLCNKKKIKNIAFCARDMRMINQAFDILYDNYNTCYFYVSRKSVMIPFLYSNNKFENFNNQIPNGRKKVTLKELLKSLNINIEINDDNKKRSQYVYKNNKKIEELYNKKIQEYIENNGKLQIKFLKKYINKLKLNNDSLIVDLGWRGTIQNMLIEILKANINGAYFHINSYNGTNINKNNVFSYSKEIAKIDNDEISSSLSLIEIIFSATHGSTVGYDEEGPILNKNQSKKYNKMVAKKIQDSSIDFINDAKKYLEILEKNNWSQKYIDRLIKLETNPTPQEIKILGNLYTDNIEERKLVNSKKLIKYVFNHNKIKYDIMESEWKTACIKNIFLVNLPYYKIVKKLKEKSKNINE